MSPWSSGYDITLTRWGSQVQILVGSPFYLYMNSCILTNMEYLLIVPRNLEDIAMRELKERYIKVISRQYRKILIEYNGKPTDLKELRAPDDVLVFLKEFKDIGHYTGKISLMYDQINSIDLTKAIAVCRQVRELPKEPTFAVTASIIGNRKMTQEYLKKAVAKALSTKGLIFKKEGKPDIDFNIMIEEDNINCGIRLFKDPLHKREYKKYSLPATLKPNIAYAMLSLAETTRKDKVLDPFCGVGTIPLEAASIGETARGIDINPEAIKKAQKNAKRANKPALFKKGDATETRLERESIDKIVTNMPFGKQSKLEQKRIFFNRLLREMSRILKPHGKAVLLTTSYQQIRESVKETREFSIAQVRSISLYGLTPTILILKKQIGKA